jgi:hypothetical protein
VCFHEVLDRRRANQLEGLARSYEKGKSDDKTELSYAVVIGSSVI